MTNKSIKAVSAISVPQFWKRFPDEKAAIDYFLDIRYKGNLTCPHCGATVSIYRYRERPKFFQCSTCNNTFSPFKDTIFKKTHLDLRLWFFAIKEFLNSRKGISACYLERELDVTYKTAWRMLQQLRIAMNNKEKEEEFSMFVQIDETYIGGKPRKANNTTGIKVYHKRGRGTNKIPVVGMKESSTSRVYAKVMMANDEKKPIRFRNQYILVVSVFVILFRRQRFSNP